MILIIDDDKEVTETVKEFLLEMNFSEKEIQTAQSGEEALRLFQNQNFKFIISDIVMPGIDGIQLLKELKKNNKAGGIKVIMMSGTHTKKEHIEIISGVEILSVLKKPFKYEDIENLLRAPS